MQVLTSHYIDKEQKNTLYDLEKRVLTIGYNDPEGENDIVVEIDRKTFTQQDYNIIENLSAIIQDSGEPGVFQLGNLKITIVSIIDHTNELIICK
jgi:patatin-like phospholipase/acyl hydrolase